MFQSFMIKDNLVYFPCVGNSLIAWGAPSFQELIVILVIVLIVFGAKRLPELARALGQSMNEFRKAKDEFEKEFHKSANTPPTLAKLDETPAASQAPSQTVPANCSSPEKTSANASSEDRST